MSLEMLSVSTLAKMLKTKQTTSVEIVKRFLKIIEEKEPTINAWAFLDPDYALYQARQADLLINDGKYIGIFHGIPVGIKDIVDTYDMPTENGSIVHKGRQPASDATIVALLRAAGAVIMGKTVTSEFAYYEPGKTRNPHNPAHTPGGSSSGSAAAVAANMIPVAVGTQTNGSVIRPAAFCGVIGFKPTHGLISRTGIFHQSDILDQVGVFANNLEDAALLAEELIAFDMADKGMRPIAKPHLYFASNAGKEIAFFAPKLAFVRSPVWDTLGENEMKTKFTNYIKTIGQYCEEIILPEPFENAHKNHQIIMETDFALSYADLYKNFSTNLSKTLNNTIERGSKTSAITYNSAVKNIDVLINELNVILNKYDAIITPATSGEAPRDLSSTGSPAFCTIWTLCGVPAITLPLLKCSSNLPLGVQVIGKRGEDSKLFSIASWLLNCQ